MLKSTRFLFRQCKLPNIKIWEKNVHRSGCLSFCDEVKNAQEAAATNAKGNPTIFDKIINKEIPVTLLHEDEKCLAFNDIAPQAPVHFLVIPKQRIDMVENVTVNEHQILGHLIQIAGKLGKEKAPNGYRLVINNGIEGCQSVYHLHVHVIGGRQLKWPPG